MTETAPFAPDVMELSGVLGGPHFDTGTGSFLPIAKLGPCPIVHMVGLAGSGMRALAAVLAARGWNVRGSDASPEACESLAAAGYEVVAGHLAAHVQPATTLLVHSAAVDSNNPELRRAARLGIPSISYADMLGKLMTGRHRLAVAGTHGKSTITAMTGEILSAAKLKPTVVYGAEPVEVNDVLESNNSTARPSENLILVEACEYRGNFLSLRPNRAVISGIEPDHFDCYPTSAALHEAFAAFVDLLPGDGLLVTPRADAVGQRISAAARCRRETFGYTADSDWQATEIASHRGRYAFTIRRRGRRFGRVPLNVVGRHNVLNALAATALAAGAGATGADIVIGLSRFAGLKRRMQYVGRIRGVELWDDYAHHPTAVAAVISALREIHPGARLCAVFEPHQVSRTAALMEEFAAALSQVDLLAVTDIFRARETASAGEVAAVDLADRVRSRGTEVLSEHDLEHIGERMLATCRPTDVLVTMGAGQIGKLNHALRNRL